MKSIIAESDKSKLHVDRGGGRGGGGGTNSYSHWQEYCVVNLVWSMEMVLAYSLCQIFESLKGSDTRFNRFMTICLVPFFLLQRKMLR